MARPKFPSDKQWNCLLDKIDQDKELLHGQFLAPNGVIRVAKKWNDIAEAVNAAGEATKSGEEWKVAYVGLKSRARQALRDRTRYSMGTGGGPSPDVVGLGLSALYERVINMTGKMAALGTCAPNPLQLQLQKSQQCYQMKEKVLQPPAAAAFRQPSVSCIASDKNNPSDAQWNCLLENISKDDDLVHGRKGTYEMWAFIGSKVNAVADATASKSDDQWKQAWNSLKYRAKKAYREKALPLMEGGAGPPDVSALGLRPIYVRVINLVGVTAALLQPGAVAVAAQQVAAVQHPAAVPAQGQGFALHNAAQLERNVILEEAFQILGPIPVDQPNYPVQQESFEYDNSFEGVDYVLPIGGRNSSTDCSQDDDVQIKFAQEAVKKEEGTYELEDNDVQTPEHFRQIRTPPSRSGFFTPSSKKRLSYSSTDSLGTVTLSKISIFFLSLA